MTSTDRRLFEANRGLTYQEATGSTNRKKEGLTHVANKRKKELDKRRTHRSNPHFEVAVKGPSGKRLA
jgi:hypothetical protein